MIPTWEEFCELIKSEKPGKRGIRIELENGLVISGEIEPEQAKRIFRDPDSLVPLPEFDFRSEVVVVLPRSKVKSRAFPSEPFASESERLQPLGDHPAKDGPGGGA